MRIPVLIIIIIILTSAIGMDLSEASAAVESNDLKKQYFYEWTDGKGNLHIADRLEKVPEQHRSKVRIIESRKAEDATPEQQPQEAFEPANGLEAEEAEAREKADWRQRLRDWNARLADAEKRYRNLEQGRNELLGAWGSSALAPVEIRLKAEEIEKRMKQARQEIDNAKNMIDVVIPEEARKAGVPPGWLRE